MMKEVMYYMKRRLDADITEENEDDDIRDYSRPRMIIFSGHDTSLSSNEIFILYALGLNINENYLTPKFASQLALEVKAKNNQKTSKYSDYYVKIPAFGGKKGSLSSEPCIKTFIINDKTDFLILGCKSFYFYFIYF